MMTAGQPPAMTAQRAAACPTESRSSQLMTDGKPREWGPLAMPPSPVGVLLGPVLNCPDLVALNGTREGGGR